MIIKYSILWNENMERKYVKSQISDITFDKFILNLFRASRLKMFNLLMSETQELFAATGIVWKYIVHSNLIIH